MILTSTNLTTLGFRFHKKNTHHIDVATQPGHSSCLHWHSTCCPGHPTCPGRPIAPVHSNSLAQPTFGKALAIWSPTSANDLPLQRQKKTPEKTNELNVSHVHHPNIGFLLKTPPTYFSTKKNVEPQFFPATFLCEAQRLSLRSSTLHGPRALTICLST